MPRPSSVRTSTKAVSAKPFKQGKATSLPKVKVSKKAFEELPTEEGERARRKKPRAKGSTKESDAERRQIFEEIEEEAARLLENGEEQAPVSVFSTHFAKVQSLIDAGQDVPLEIRTEAFLQATLSAGISLMPLAEVNYRKTGKESSMYSMVALINKIGDLLNDVKMSESVDGKIVTIKQLIHTSFVRVTDLLMREKYNLQAAVDGVTSNPELRKAMRKEIDNTILSFGKGMHEHEKLVSMQIGMFISGDGNYLNPMSSGQDEDSPKKKRKKKKR